jgi:hypothetical protein
MQGSETFWAVIRCNLRDLSTAGEFNRWYNQQHAPRYIRQRGFRRGWRLENSIVPGSAAIRASAI